jgi:23S rRNA pseudouridine2605 synthase
MIRLNKYIASCGVCSRRKADDIIQKGNVKVNGKTVEDFGIQIDEKKDIVEIYDKKIKLEKSKLYLMLNKPKGYITTNDEQFMRPSTVELINEDIRVFPVGRLDMDTEGLLVFTNDGDFANKVIHPKNKIEKTYVVRFKEGEADPKKIEKMKKGVDIGDYVTKPAKVRLMSKNQLEIIISEGKNRQIRKMCEVVGIDVYDLKRTKIGMLELGDLKVGEYRKLKPSEIKLIIG